MALPTGTPIATCSISNDTSGYTQLLAWTAVSFEDRDLA
jgi:hypothetical protein